MISETINLPINFEALRSHFEREVAIRPANMTTEWYGGWSVLSSNGSYLDGWGAARLHNPDFMPGHTIEEKMAALGTTASHLHVQPTEICTGDIVPPLKTLLKLGFKIWRARFSILKPGGESSWHRDAPDEAYAVRLHIPISTNPECLFVCEEGSEHWPADNSAYFVRVNRMHKVVNRGSTDRIHFIVNIRDPEGLTKHHQFKA